MIKVLELIGPQGVVTILVGCALLLGLLLAFLSRAPSRALVSRRFVTGNETEFLARLRRALPQYDVSPQVAMSALMDVGVPEWHPDYWDIRKTFAMKTVDYVVLERVSQKVVAVVELDDRTHDAKKAKDARRDSALASVGITTVRWDSRRKPTPDAIASRFAQLAKIGQHRKTAAA